MGKFDDVVINRFSKQQNVLMLYRVVLSQFWYIDTSKSLMMNDKCYKILTFDPQDEVIDLGSAIHHGVAYYFSQTNYNKPEWKKFYQSLTFIFDLEKQLEEHLSKNNS